MKVINIHQRLIHQPKTEIAKLFQTLATSEDKIWPKEKWPAMRLNDGLQIGSQGGHGRIRYTVVDFKPGFYVKFQFTKPIGFQGIHELTIKEESVTTTEIRHNIKMETKSVKATFLWVFIIRWLHDALIEDAFDKVEQHFSSSETTTSYNLWVACLRYLYKRKGAIKHN
ncbi:hypothetical protein [Psychroserpens algicola]|uniref:SRPBCC family protein n=1 Tax=Psychroserpens algicola TaxID=1719034 RepID=A0ABT0H7R2_9FLAO|nr:hypothetical protein [Psychroserpens algicola]MCK8479887.1 hypothetical protein [Psychroserpens algicola]